MFAALLAIIFLVGCNPSGVFAGMEIPAEVREYINDLHDICIKKSGITEEMHIEYDINDKNPQMMCYMKCLMLESRWMKKDGTIQYDFISSTIHPEVKGTVLAALDQCRNIPDTSDLCEKAYNFNKCMYHADTENWFFI